MRREVLLVVVAAVVWFLMAGGFGVARSTRLRPVSVSGAGDVESTWQGTWYTLVDTNGSGQWSCSGVLGAEVWPATFAKDWGTGPVFGANSDNLCFSARITVYVRQSRAYRFDFKNIDDGARLYDANGNLLFDAVCSFLSCPVQNGKDVNLERGQSELGLEYWQYSGQASISFLATDPSIFANAAPTVSFTYSPSSVLVGEPVSFSAIATDSDGDPITYAWTFGTAFDSQANPTHTFGAPGTYPVTLTVTDEFGASASSTQDVVVNARPLATTARASPTSGQAPLEVSFTCSGDAGTPPYSFEWNFGDGSPVGLGDQVGHVYSKEGTYTATCTVRDTAGQTVMASVVVSVSTAPLFGLGPSGLNGTMLSAILIVAGAVVLAVGVVGLRRRRRRRASPPVG